MWIVKPAESGENMTILITGGAGFIGSNFIYYQLDNHPEDRIVCLDKLTYAGRKETLEPAMQLERFRFVQGDICDRNVVFRLFEEEKPDLVVHFAAESHVDRSIEAPDLFLQTNVMGTAVLLDACRMFEICRFHQVSTDEVYGELPLDRPELLFTEDMPLHPSSPYSSSKAAGDLLALSYARTYGLPVSISRGANNYGPHQFPEKLIPRMILCALQNEPLPVYGDGLQMRDWVYVADHCRAIDLIVRQGRTGEIYNIGSGCEMRNLDVVRQICRELDRPESLIVHVEDRKGHDLRYGVDTAKIRSELGWEPEVSFADGLHQTVQWYLENQYMIDSNCLHFK